MLWVSISVLWNLFICLGEKTHSRSMEQGYSIKTQGLKESHNWAWSPEAEFLLLWLSLSSCSTGRPHHWMRPVRLIRSNLLQISWLDVSHICKVLSQLHLNEGLINSWLLRLSPRWHIKLRVTLCKLSSVLKVMTSEQYRTYISNFRMYSLAFGIIENSNCFEIQSLKTMQEYRIPDLSRHT